MLGAIFEYIRGHPRAFKLLRRVIRATLLSIFAFYLLTYPLGKYFPMWFVVIVARVFDFPISLLNAVLPWQLASGFASQFSTGTLCFPGPAAYERFRYLAVGIPAWTMVLYIPDAVRTLWPKVRQHVWHGA